MTDRELDSLRDISCNPRISKSELRRVALVAIGEFSMLRAEHARLREFHARKSDLRLMELDSINSLKADLALEVPIA